MGCGCKNKGNVAPPAPQPQGQPINRAQTQSESIQSAIKKNGSKVLQSKKIIL
jgi:hypothetical protein